MDITTINIVALWAVLAAVFVVFFFALLFLPCGDKNVEDDETIVFQIQELQTELNTQDARIQMQLQAQDIRIREQAERLDAISPISVLAPTGTVTGAVNDITTDIQCIRENNDLLAISVDFALFSTTLYNPVGTLFASCPPGTFDEVFLDEKYQRFNLQQFIYIHVLEDGLAVDHIETAIFNVKVENRVVSWSVRLPSGYTIPPTSSIAIDPQTVWFNFELTPPEPHGRPFIFTIDTDPTAVPPFQPLGPNISDSDEFILPIRLVPGMIDQEYTIDWGDGSGFEHVTLMGDKIHQYAVSGEYQIRIWGNPGHIHNRTVGPTIEDTINNPTPQGDNAKWKSVDQWGDIQWQSCDHMFASCDLLENINTEDEPDFSQATNFDLCFFFQSWTEFPSKQYDFSSAVSCVGMFSYIVNVSNFVVPDLPSAIDLQWILFGIAGFGMTTITFGRLDKVESLVAAFQHVSTLTTVTFTQGTPSLLSMDGTFDDCTGLTTIIGMETATVTNMNTAFDKCVALQDLGFLDTSSLELGSEVFIDMGTLDVLPTLDLRKITTGIAMFNNTTLTQPNKWSDILLYLDSHVNELNEDVEFGGGTNIANVPAQAAIANITAVKNWQITSA